MRAKVFGSFFSHIGDVRTTGKSGSYRIKIITVTIWYARRVTRQTPK